MIPFPDLGKVNALEREQLLASFVRMLIRDKVRVRRVTVRQYSGMRVFGYFETLHTQPRDRTIISLRCVDRPGTLDPSSPCSP